jgi:hypothetical protein
LVTRDGELAVLAGSMKIELHRTRGSDQLTLAVTLPGGGEIVAFIPRHEWTDIDILEDVA